MNLFCPGRQRAKENEPFSAGRTVYQAQIPLNDHASAIPSFGLIVTPRSDPRGVGIVIPRRDPARETRFGEKETFRRVEGRGFAVRGINWGLLLKRNVVGRPTAFGLSATIGTSDLRPWGARLPISPPFPPLDEFCYRMCLLTPFPNYHFPL